MATLQEVLGNVDALKSLLSSVDVKLDTIKTRIDQLQAGQVISQEELDALNEAISSAKESASSVLAEADSLDGQEEPAPSPEPSPEPEPNPEG